MANFLGHYIAPTFSGADAFEDAEMKIPVEYKATISKKITVTYNGISRQETWEQQEAYLRDEKICKYKNHYFARYDGPDIAELWVMDGEKVLELLIEPLKKQYFNKANRKDPRLGCTISKKKIQQHATQMYPNPN